jgi:hypothetical protein
MKMKSFLLVAIIALMAVGAVAQVGGNDYTFAGGPFTITRPDSTTWTYSIYYSPSTVKRSGDIVTFTYETVTAGSSTNFYQNNVNCRTHQYTFAKYDTHVTPVAEITTLSAPSGWTDILPNTAGATLQPIVCK